MTWFFVAVAVVVAAGTLYWLLIITEGTYLGAHVVAMLYNWVARRYDAMKGFDPAFEEAFLTRPILSALGGRPAPLVLDVATGTGRVPALLLAAPAFSGRVVGIDFSRAMLAVAATKTAGQARRVTYIWQNAMQLPFPDASFDLVTCLEALEFTPYPEQVLQEIVRVARPDSQVLVTHRRGWEGKVMPGKCWSAEGFVSLLGQVGLRDLRIAPWQQDYSLVWGRVGDDRSNSSGAQAEELLCCLACRKPGLVRDGSEFLCMDCDTRYAVAKNGIIEMAATRRTRRRH